MSTNVTPQGAGGSRDPSPDAVWRDALAELELTQTRATFDRWLTRAALGPVDGDNWTIVVPNDETRDWLDNRLRTPIERTVAAVAGRPVSLSFAVGVAPSRNGSGPEEGPAFADADTPSWVRDVVRQPGQVLMKKERKDPAGPYLMVPHYAFRFWQPLLGARAFALFITLNHCVDAHKYFGEPLPSIQELVDMLGYGVRHTLLGRAGTAKRPEQTGTLDELAGFNLVKLWRIGKGGGTRYVFAVYPVEDLPLLTPAQVGMLSDKKQREHETWFSHFRLFDPEGWRQDRRPTAIPDRWWAS